MVYSKISVRNSLGLCGTNAQRIKKIKRINY